MVELKNHIIKCANVGDGKHVSPLPPDFKLKDEKQCDTRESHNDSPGIGMSLGVEGGSRNDDATNKNEVVDF